MISVDTGVYTNGTPMSANDLAQWKKILDMSFTELINAKLTIVVFISDRSETYAISGLSIRREGNNGWYDISIKLNHLSRDIIFNKGRMINGTY